MKDKYLRLKHCCAYMEFVLTWEPTMGYEPMVYCNYCRTMQEFPLEEEE